jgi:hypothetical protein
VNGRINVYNPLNGNYMKSCPHDISSVVMSLVYLSDHRRFLAGYVNGAIRLYDENKLDDCFTIRTFDFFNSHRELLLMSYSSVDRSVVTAGSIGQPIKFWDFDTGKCDLELEVCGESETIVSLSLLEPYPLVVTSDSTGNIVVWGSRGCKWKGDKITSFVNINPLDAEMEPPSKGDHYNGIPPQRVLPNSYLSDELEETSVESPSHHHHTPHSHSHTHRRSSTEQFILENSNQHSIRGVEGDEVEHLSEIRACEAKWGKVSAATKLSWDRHNHMLYTGDELGHLRKWSLSHVIDELGGMSMMHGLKHIKAKITTRRNLKKGVSGMLYADGNTTAAMPLLLTKKTQIAFMNIEFCWALQGHNETIIECLATSHGVLTSSTDNLVKMWTTEGLFIGTLLHSIPVGIRSHSWDLPIDVQSIRAAEEEELDHTMGELREMNQQMKRSPTTPALSTSQQQQHSFFTRQNTIDETKLGQSSLRKRIEMSGKLLGLDFLTPGTVESTRGEEPSQRRRPSVKGIDSLPQRPSTSYSPTTKVLPSLPGGGAKPRQATHLKNSDQQRQGTPGTPLRIEITTPGGRTVNSNHSTSRGKGGGSGVRQSFQNKILTQTEQRCSHLSSFEKLESSIKKSEVPSRATVVFSSVEESERKRGQTIAEIRQRFNLETPVLANDPGLLAITPGTDFSRFESDQGFSASFSRSETPAPSAVNTGRRTFMRQFSSTNSNF